VEHPNAAAFNAFEAAGWNEAALGYHDFFRSITPRVVEPLLDAVAAGRGRGCSMSPRAPATWRQRPPSEERPS
jgi:hypothetical protein